MQLQECVCFVHTQAVRAVYGETHEDDVSVWIGERSQSVIVFLTCCVPKSQLHLTNIEKREGKEGQKMRFDERRTRKTFKN